MMWSFAAQRFASKISRGAPVSTDLILVGLLQEDCIAGVSIRVVSHRHHCDLTAQTAAAAFNVDEATMARAFEQVVNLDHEKMRW